MVYMVTYEFRSPFPGNRRANLERALSTGPWAHAISNTWFISTGESISDLYNRLGLFFTEKDYLLINRIIGTTPYFGWLPKEVWEWLDNELRSERVWAPRANM